MFTKILIANRGEIAARVITTARRMGIATVAVYSDADAGALHVEMADEAVRIGPAPVAESYLLGDRIIDAALSTGAQAIHPGYGFLSENPDFVEAVEAAGLTFIGPPASAIRAMGLKDAAKDLMIEAGVPVVPGYQGADQDPDLMAAEADKIGYPVLIKARAGGGGKGMRLVEDPADFAEALKAAQREGQSSFGDPACLIEKYITTPRHIEIQIMGDGHGNVVHLFERDCSLQRRHQKVIEEAPAPDMPEAVRAAMGRAAVEAARAISYTGAGTVEFIVDGSGPLREDGFWFMEMNTRLQVEHPVSEAITGLDFVELQLRVAAGERLPIAQDDLRIDGWAFEARLYAEDVAKGFLPATGTLDHLSFPDGTRFARGPVRIDSGVREGDEISPWYDPMIAKVVVHGPTREVALNMLAQALGACHVAGSVTNLAFLGALARHDGFGKGKVDTGLIARDIAALSDTSAPNDLAVALAALGALGLLDVPDSTDLFTAFTGFRLWGAAQHLVHLDAGDTRIEARVTLHGAGRFTVETSEDAVTLTAHPAEGAFVRIQREDRRVTAKVLRTGPRITVFSGSRSHGFTTVDPLAEAEDAGAGGDGLTAPMPGRVLGVSVAAGDTVTKGTALIVLEAMKMEHTLRAPRDGQVAELLVGEGDQVADGTLLLTLEPGDD
ncbi:acetyl/propionyl/methylcrotonyl-CoA carboxylase subunit alpha [Salipiger sp. IMCC34102]|uniref:acetyl/propionyl/methylcrotonyl-CoA carboxylase subunit alpha n=1 Tax=Salipiger sp. IMCC34102 TaxID=2510647 RepID=UPI00101DD99B|nr:acetyl/propionyl/methylcrotonyl-CoA carboxylase subunit alpha [Salipiger sp. IMCC34102]RYH03049.1 acetyl/propionyl/methylcrotonyl-CoA carboxylase subunit alpha [Salipiger sp. IMCC34102]